MRVKINRGSISLKNKLQKISAVYDAQTIVNQNIELTDIQTYYKVNSIAYSLFHTNDDFMYMGISRDGVYKHEDLKAQAHFIDAYIKKIGAKNVLELASGRSANTAYLAKNNPDVKFYGLELSEGQIKYARKKAEKLGNLKVELGDYHDLSTFNDIKFDVVYVVEALCYSTEKEKVLEQVSLVLNNVGLFIVFDGYRGSKVLSSDEELACKLTEKTMALQAFESYESFVQKAKETGFGIEFEEDLSKYVLPTMKRFEKLASIYFALPITAKLLNLLLPKEFVLNSVAGYLMPTLVENGIARYMVSVLKR